MLGTKVPSRKSCMSYVGHLEGLIVADCSEFYITRHFPMGYIANDAGETWKFAIVYFSGDGRCEVVNG